MIFSMIILSVMLRVDAIEKPHIILAIVDDMGWGDVTFDGGDGSANIQHPNFNKLAGEGVKLDRAYAYSWCCPSRSSILSGRMPTRVNVNKTNEVMRTNASSTPYNMIGNGIPAGMSGMGLKMKEAGYDTFYHGKWGVGYMWKEQMPKARGFDHFFGYLQDTVSYWTQQRTPNASELDSGCETMDEFTDPYITDLWMSNKEGVDGPADLRNGTGWIDFQFLDESLKAINHHNTLNPLFLLHAFHSVHNPLDPPMALMEEYVNIVDPTRRAYASMVNFCDSAVGDMVDALKTKNMWENTILVVTSDNGGPIYAGFESGNRNKPLEWLFGGASNLPLRGSKTSEFEGGLRVKSFVSGGIIPEKMRGVTVDSYVHVSDWYATFCELAGVDKFDDMAFEHNLPPVDSISQWPMLSGSHSEDHEPLRTEMHISATALIDHEWKLLTGRDMDVCQASHGLDNASFPVETLPFSYYGVGYGPNAYVGSYPEYMRTMSCPNGCLWNIQDDPNESYECGAQFPEVLEKMKRKLAKLNADHLFIPYRGPEDVEFAACRRMHDAGFTGPYTNVSEWKFQSSASP